MTEVAAIILAAGLSRRMGRCNKLLLPIDGVPMIRHMVETYRAVTTVPVVVVTGHEADLVEAVLSASGVRTVYNPDFASGQQSSVACGLRTVESAAQILIGLGDQPMLTPTDLRALLAAHAAADPARISIPLLEAARGNPIVVPGALHARLLADPRAPGCKSFTRAHPEHVQFHALPNPGLYADVDTPQAYAALTLGTLEETP